METAICQARARVPQPCLTLILGDISRGYTVLWPWAWRLSVSEDMLSNFSWFLDTEGRSPTTVLYCPTQMLCVHYKSSLQLVTVSL